MPQSEEVITVCGTISPDEMGITQTHEHLQVDALDHYGTYDLVIDDEEQVINELIEFTAAGGKTICDVTLDEIGRNPLALKRISEASGVQVLMGSGWYRQFGYPTIVNEKTSCQLAEHLIREIEVGVGDSGIRAGFIGEIGTGRHHILPAEERVFRAAAIAQQATGVVISTHTTHWGNLAKEQIDLLTEYGVQPDRIIIGHLGDRRGVHHLLPIVDRGVYVEVDNIGYLDYQPESVRADNVASLVAEGFVEQILLSEDICMLSHLKSNGGKGYGYLLKIFVPMLRERGVTDDDIHTILVRNPARAFVRKIRDKNNI